LFFYGLFFGFGIGKGECVSEMYQYFGSALVDGNLFARGEMKGKKYGVDLMISSAKKGFLEMSNLFKSVGIGFVSVFKIESCTKKFRIRCEEFSQMSNPYDNQHDKNHRPKQSAFSFSDIIVPAKIGNTHYSRINEPSHKSNSNEGSEDFFSDCYKSLCFHSE
jgi:hypothetical protein